MTIGASQALSGSPFLPRPAREEMVVAEAVPARPRPPVERIVEGVVLGRDRHRAGDAEFAARLRVHAQAGSGAQGMSPGVATALAAYTGIASGAPVQTAPRIDVFA